MGRRRLRRWIAVAQRSTGSGQGELVCETHVTGRYVGSNEAMDISNIIIND